jgi:hypothetical protein
MTVPVSAAQGLALDTQQGQVGDTVTCTVRVEQAPNAVRTFGFDMVYDHSVALAVPATVPPGSYEVRLLERSHQRSDDAGRLTRRLQREMASLWTCLREQGVEATNHRAERS